MRASVRVVLINKSMRLKSEPQTELNFSRRISSRNIAEIVGKVVGADGLEVGPIEDIEKVCSESQVRPLAEFPALVG